MRVYILLLVWRVVALGQWVLTASCDKTERNKMFRILPKWTCKLAMYLKFIRRVVAGMEVK
jgi:hypothetical protein